MKAISYTKTGDPDVLRLTERPTPEPGPGEVRVRVTVSGVNPTDWKNRRADRPAFPEVVPNQDGAGVVDAVGPDVRGLEAGQRVWLWEAQWQRADGTAQEYVVLPARQAVPLPDDASFDLGASLGIPALTAHRALTVAETGPSRLSPGALAGRSVLVAGGAGAVGHAAIELARWAGADVVTTVSSPEKARLATAAGARHVVNYRTEDAAEAIRKLFPDGVDLVVEVAPGPNAALNQAVLAPNGTIAVYANNGGEELTLTIRPHMVANARYQFVFVYTVPPEAKEHAVADVSAAVADGALRVGDEAGLPLHRFPLERTADAHAAVERGVVGKVLIDVG
ncbi:NADPH2:quinone reductase [Amycolatopsis bartoniae]|uniref:NADPH:quinone reductase n=1 Tax=Amycolatopsis bartoniae TaxID=941986 RepID=A0A8H9M6I6_9PSEU|nr:NADPH:quinone reductase [Amycolatopsis bartoniae]MBB2938977.1 NADPH2:quinone reductase [Amycolatopsis bartoniae]TVT11224.1 NADPH:quinone reductase [Amycolatopsis bartoniae]GHF65810.1 NADPH:quinone reductase [Amycolatopsis bartoniae]